MKKNSLLDNSLPFCLKPKEGRVSAPILSIPTDFSFVSFFFPSHRLSNNRIWAFHLNNLRRCSPP